MAKNVYRQTALDKLATPEELDKMIRVTDLKGWIALAGLMIIVFMAILWGIFGSIPTVIRGNGVLIRQDGIQQLTAPGDGLISEFSVKAGDTVKEGQLIGKFKSLTGEADLKSNFNGNVLEIFVQKNVPIKADSPIANIEITSQPLKGVILVPLSEGKRLRQGLKVQMAPAIAQAEQNGYLLGTVSRISQYPVSPETLYAEFKSKELVEALINGPVIKVDVDLQPDQTTFSKFKWSTPNGPKATLTNGTLFSANLLLGEQRPISLVLPILNEQGT